MTGLTALAASGPAAASPALGGGLECGAWNVVETPRPGGFQDIRAVSGTSAEDVWAVGFAGDASGFVHALVLHFDGVEWTAAEPPSRFLQTRLFGVLALAPDDVWAVGDAYEIDRGVLLSMHWNGFRWRTVPIHAEGQLTAVGGVGPDDLWAVGYGFRNGYDQPLAVRWDGVAWTSVRVPRPGVFGQLYGVAAVATDDVFAVGRPGLIEHWAGDRWRFVMASVASEPLYGASAAGPDDVWAVGASGPDSLVSHWDGVEWTAENGPSPGRNVNDLNGVHAVGSDDVWAVGTFGDRMPERGGRAGLAVHFDGSDWVQVPTPNAGGGRERDVLRGVWGTPGGPVWAVGQTADDGVRRTLAERFDPC